MRRYQSILCLVFLLSALCATAQASSVALVKEGARSDRQAQATLDSRAIVLTFGDDRVVIYDPPLSLPGSRTIAQDVASSELFIVRDYRPMSDRTGYETIYSHSGFKLAIVKNPKELATIEDVSLQPVTESLVVTRKPDLGKAVPDPTVSKVLSMLKPSMYKHYMSRLAQNLSTRYSCANGQLTARNVCRNLFTRFGFATSLEEFTNSCWYSCQKRAGFNVIGVKKGLVRPEEYYLVGAHYDSSSGNPCQNARGANDNASGAAGVLELARVFSQLNTEASIVFAAFSGEEQGLLGSKKYVQNLIDSGSDANLKAFVVLDMISYYKNNRGIVIEGSAKTPEQLAVLDRLALYGATYTDLQLEISTIYARSDHKPFLDQEMAGALLIEADWSQYSYYHTTKDLLAYQNIPFGLEVVKVAAAMLAQEAKVIPAQ
jgi:hypothetical protein